MWCVCFAQWTPATGWCDECGEVGTVCCYCLVMHKYSSRTNVYAWVYISLREFGQGSSISAADVQIFIGGGLKGEGPREGVSLSLKGSGAMPQPLFKCSAFSGK